MRADDSRAAGRPAAPQTSFRAGFQAWLGAAAVAALAVAATAAATAGLYARAGAEAAAPIRDPLPVTVAPLRRAQSYAYRESVLGRVEPRRESRLAFERPGLVEAVLVDEGDRVRRGQQLARLDHAALEIEDARLAAEQRALEADLALAEATTRRRAQLSDRGFESGQSFDEARFSAAATEARIAAIDAQRRRIALDREKSVLKAPFDAVVSTRGVDEGAVAAAGSPILTVQEVDRPQARIGAPVDLARSLALGEAVTLRAETTTLSGRVAAIAPRLDPATRTVAVLIDIDPAEPIAMGDVVRLERERTIAAEGAWAPLAALSDGVRGLWRLRLVLGPDGAPLTDQAGPVAGGRLGATLVEALYVRDGRAFVRGAFPDGALVVLEGPHRGASGQPVSFATATTDPAR